MENGGNPVFKSGVGFHYNVNNCERTLEFYADKLGGHSHPHTGESAL